MEILRGVSLRVEAGQVVSIIGPNGAGKSTVFKTLFGLLPVRQGQVRFAGEDVTNQAPAELLRRGMTYVPQGRNVFPLMTVEQNLRLGAYIRPRSAALDRDVERVYEIFPMLGEATLGLAPFVFKEIFRIIEGLRQRGQTILMVEQNAANALEISDYAYVL